MSPSQPPNRSNEFRKVKAQTGSKLMKNCESSDDFRRPEHAVQSSVRSFVTVQSVIKLYVVLSILCVISAYELRFGCFSGR